MNLLLTCKSFKGRHTRTKIAEAVLLEFGLKNKVRIVLRIKLGPVEVQNFVTVTTDLWSDRRQRPYLAVTAHVSSVKTPRQGITRL